MQVMAVSNVSEMPEAGLFAYFAVYCLGVFGSAYNRFTIRENLDIKGNIIFDFLSLCCCDVCSSVQEYRHVMAVKHGDDKRPPWRIR
jgi:Cys-rich protein (TIGR01571 family)